MTIDHSFTDDHLAGVLERFTRDRYDDPDECWSAFSNAVIRGPGSDLQPQLTGCGSRGPTLAAMAQIDAGLAA